MNNHLSGGFFAIHDKLMIFIKKCLSIIVRLSIIILKYTNKEFNHAVKD